MRCCFYRANKNNLIIHNFNWTIHRKKRSRHSHHQIYYGLMIFDLSKTPGGIQLITYLLLIKFSESRLCYSPHQTCSIFAADCTSSSTNFNSFRADKQFFIRSNFYVSFLRLLHIHFFHWSRFIYVYCRAKLYGASHFPRDSHF